jgi:hypothetical protein
VRLAAECASGVRGIGLWFTYRDGSIEASAQRPPGVVALGPVDTSPDAIRTFPLKSVSISLPDVEDPLVIPGTEADALYWSEAAVEKFLLPYYVSVGGWAAGDLLLSQLAKAWFDYSATAVQVVAVGYRRGLGPAEGPLTVGKTCFVVYSRVQPDGRLGPLARDSVESFVNTPGFIGPARGKDLPLHGHPSGCIGVVPYTGATLNSIGCRELAEFARGVRGQYLSFVPQAGGMAVHACPGAAPCEDAPEGVFTCLTLPGRPDRPAPSGVSAWVDGEVVPLVGPDRDHVLLPAPPDSMVWGDGALEELMLPYYASVMGRQAPFFNALLVGQWDGHMNVVPRRDDDAGPLAIQALQNIVAGVGPASSSVFAVVHLPRSEYVPASPVDVGGSSLADQTLASRTVLLSYDGHAFRSSRVRP